VTDDEDASARQGAASATHNLAGMIESHPAEDVALISANRRTTYGELRQQAGGVRGGLVELGIGRGDRIALICGNGRSFVVAYLATLGVGAVAVPLNPASPPPELEGQLRAVAAVAVVVDRLALASWQRIDRDAIPSVRHVVVCDGDSTPGTHRLDDLAAHEPVELAAVEPGDVAVMMFTSGTAGAPRAAMLSHANLRSNIEQSLGSRSPMRRDDVVYGVLPLFHIFGLNVMLGIALTVGASIVLVQRFDPATAAESVVTRNVTVLPGAPAMWVAFAHFDELAPDTFRNVRLALSGASRLPVAVAEACRDRFGLVIAEGYGLTEASPVVTSSAGLPPRFGSVGQALAGLEVRLVGDDGADVLVGDVGELHVRGPNVFLGYLDDPDATARVLDGDGWLHTGDLATVDDEGWLYLVDRAKDLIIVSGFNVYPLEVEEVLRLHPGIAEVGVVGVPHPHTGEAVKAYVVLEPGTLFDEDALIADAADHLARYKCPTKVVVVDELPRNLNGKLLRRNLGQTVLDDAVRDDDGSRDTVRDDAVLDESGGHDA
jgi:long-chain acyl-CoA synthetase